MSERFRLVQDDDGHWYVIPTKLRTDFEIWMDEFTRLEIGSDAYFEFDFDKFREYMISGHPSRVTFENPEENQ